MKVRVNLSDSLVKFLLCSIPFMTFSIGNFFGSWITPYYIFSIILFFFSVGKNLLIPKYILRFKSLFLLILLLIVILLSDFYSCLGGFEDLKVQFKYLIQFLIFLTIPINLFFNIKSEQQLLKIFKSFTCICIFIFVYGIYQHVSVKVATLPYSNLFCNDGQTIISSAWPTAPYLFWDRIWATFPESSVYGNFLLAFVPIFIAMAFFHRNNCIYKAASILGITNLVLAGSSGAMFALLSGTVVFLFIISTNFNIFSYFIKKPKLLLTSAILLIISLIIIFPSIKRFQTSFEVIATREISTDISYATRFIGQRAALKAFLANPLIGIGYGNFSKQFIHYLDPKIPITPEIQYVIDYDLKLNPYGTFTRLLSETGILGFSVFLLILAYGVKTCVSLIKSKNPLFSKIGVGYLFGFVCINMHGLIDTTFLFPQWWLLYGLIISSQKLFQLRSFRLINW